MKIMQYVLGFFGYTKITRDVVMLSIAQEASLEEWIKITHSPTLEGWNKAFRNSLKGQCALTQFLRSGRLLT